MFTAATSLHKTTSATNGRGFVSGATNGRGFVVAALAGLLFAFSSAQAADIDPIESGGEALQEGAALPWYDAATDELRPVNVVPPAEPPRPADAASPQPKPASGNNTNWSTGGLERLFAALPWLGGGLIVLIILGLLVLVIRTMAERMDGPNLELPENSRRIVSDLDRMEQLPVPLKRDVNDLLGEAQRQYEQGNYNEGIIYLYSYLLVELDKAQRIRLLRGKTNRQYLREIRDAPPTLVGLVERTMVAFEDVFFGDHDLERARFEDCYNHLSEFHQYVAAEPVAV